MTVIVYRDGIMAGDSCWTEGERVTQLRNKVFRLPSGALYGAAGAVDDRALMQLLANVNLPADMPSAEQLAQIKHDIGALLILPCGTIWELHTGPEESDASVCEFVAPFFAIGTGKEIAIGAMEAGASAVEAVKAACNRNVYCRPPIHAISLPMSEMCK